MIIELKDAIRRINCLGYVKLIDCMPRYIPVKYNHLKCDYALVDPLTIKNGNEAYLITNIIRTLMKNKVTSSFEMIKFNFHMKMPLFVKKEWNNLKLGVIHDIKSEIERELYIPTDLHFEKVNNEKLTDVYKVLLENNLSCLDNYEKLLKLGVPTEKAQIFLPQNIYTEFFWSIDLHNYLNFIKLKNFNTHALNEYVNATIELVRDLCPATFKVYDEYESNSVTFNKREQAIIKANLNNFNVMNFNFNSVDDKREFLDKLVNMKTK